MPTNNNSPRIPPEGQRYLRTIFHEHRQVNPDKAVLIHILHELQAHVPNTGHITLDMIRKWFGHERQRDINETPSLSNPKKWDLEKWWSANPNPTKELMGEWARKLKAEFEDVMIFIDLKNRAKQLRANNSNSLSAEQAGLVNAIQQYNLYQKSNDLGLEDPSSDFPGNTIVRTNSETETANPLELGDDFPNLESLLHPPASELVTTKLMLGLASIDRKEVDQIVDNYANKGSAATKAMPGKRKGGTVYPRTARELDELFKPYKEKIDKITEMSMMRDSL